MHGNVLWVDGAQSCRVNQLQRGFFLFKFTQYGVGTDAQHPRGIAHPLELRLMSMICCFTSGKQPRLR